MDPNDEYSDDDIWKSLENSHLKDFVSGLSEGLQHTIDEGGGNLRYVYHLFYHLC